MVISRLLRATMVAGDSGAGNGPHTPPSNGSARGETSAGVATAPTPSDALSQERR